MISKEHEMRVQPHISNLETDCWHDLDSGIPSLSTIHRLGRSQAWEGMGHDGGGEHLPQGNHVSEFRQDHPVGRFFDAVDPGPTQAFDKSDRWFWDLREKVHKPLRDFQRARCKRVKIAILDTGIYLGHDDFKDDEAKGTGKIFVKDFLPSRTNNAAQEADDKDGHGTHCAGLLRRVAPAADIYVAKIAHDTDSIDHLAVAEAIRYAVDETQWDVDILSLSFGFTHDTRIDKTVVEAISRALERRKLVFAATSNSGTPGFMAYPAWHAGVIAVNSADADGKPSAFLPRDTADLGMFTALGEAVKSAWIIRSDLAPPPTTTTETSPTRRMTGTSVATPIAAGIAALVLQAAATVPCRGREGGTAPAQPARLLRYLKWEPIMRDVLKELSALNGGYRNLLPCDLARTGLDGSQVAAFLERVVAQKSNMARLD